MPRISLEDLGLAPLPSISLFCSLERAYRQHRYLGVTWHAGETNGGHLSGSLELVYQCRLCDAERLLGVLILCGPRPPRPVPKLGPGRPRKVEF